MIDRKKSDANYGVYCRGVAELYLLLRETIGLEKVKKDESRYLWNIKHDRRGKKEVSPEKNLNSHQIEERQLWLSRAMLILEPEQRPASVKLDYTNQKPRPQFCTPELEKELNKFADELEKSPGLLFRVLHALDRGDETYFLYLALEIEAIRVWMEENKLPWFICSGPVASPSGSPAVDSAPESENRVQEAEPWKDAGIALEKQKREARTKLEQLGPRPKNEAEAGPWDELRKTEQLEREGYFEFLRRSEFREKIRSWVQAEQRKRTADDPAIEPAGKPKLLEELVCCVLAGEGPDLKELAERLFEHPSEQSKLAMLLGKTPSRWLREEEAESLWARRAYQRKSDPSCEPELPDDLRTPPRDVAGMCFSGGGIRSATFNLGILQALAELKLLGKFDYLSTVSGGGYIHQWLAAWWKRESVNEGESVDALPSGPGSAFETVRKALVAQPASTLPGIEATQISFLRQFSNYLTPRIGAVTTDTWTAIAIWMRNTFLVLLIIMAALLVVFSLLRAGIVGLDGLADCHGKRWWVAPAGLALLLIGGGLILCWFRRYARWINVEPKSVSSETWREPGVNDQRITLALVAIFCGAVFYTIICMGSPTIDTAGNSGLLMWLWSLRESREALALLLVVMLWPIALGWAGFTDVRYEKAYPMQWGWKHRLWTIVSGLISGALVWFLMAAGFRFLWKQVPRWWQELVCFAQEATVRGTISTTLQEMFKALVTHVDKHPRIFHELVFVFAPPLLMMALFLSSVLHLGLNKLVFRDEVLEWMARLRSLGFLVSFGWLAATGCVVLAGPLFAALAGLKAATWWSFATTAWGAISGGGAFAAKKEDSGGNSFWAKYGRPVLVALAPWVFVIGLFVGLAALVSTVTMNLDGTTNVVHMAMLFGLSLLVAAAYGWQVDINEMSMFSFYRNRLARCYQGASVIDRRPDPFTGFSRDDRSLGLAELRYTSLAGVNGTYPGPFPIFCCTLNFSSGEEMAWQERKGASFAYTPLYSGYDIPWTGIDREEDSRKVYYNGFRDTTDLGKPYGPPLADVCAASGAAVSPAWGYRTRPGLSFLMTCFNARLGVWKRNTRYPMRSDNAVRTASPRLEPQSPRVGLWYLFRELFAKTNAKSEFLYLSDGGHFDNMGLYELVRRECRYIVICDAECDGNLNFEGLAMAVRKCRTDFGVDIQLDVKKLRKDKDTGFSDVHCVVGTILYPNEDPQTPSRDRGKIVYLKSTMTGGEPADLLSYKLEHPVFPHDSTGNQWFSESQFESYRTLGRFIGMTSLKNACQKDGKGGVECGGRSDYFNRMYDTWYPATPAIEQHLNEHESQFEAILSELRSKSGYAQSVNELFDKTRQLLSLSSTDDLQYFDALALTIFDFIWQVFNDLDLHLASSREHPQAEAWMNTFQRWLEMNFMRLAWDVYRMRYPESFHFFLKQHLNFG